MTMAKTAKRKQYAALVAQRPRDKLNTVDTQLRTLVRPLQITRLSSLV
jgi:hypothetical protein